MTSPEARHVLIGVSGGIAAYKTPDLVRRLKRSGFAVRVVLTAGAAEFVTPLTFQAVSGEPVGTDLLDPAAEAAMGHIELARWADLILVAPATAHCLAGLAAGLAGDLLGTVCLASRAPLAVAPAMNQAMWAHPATAENVQRLRQRGVAIWGPDSGSQACGDEGPGRMLEPEALCRRVEAALAVPAGSGAAGFGQQDPGAGTGAGCLAGLEVLVTAGPTRERIDPVRFLSNDSSGKQGFALAAAAAAAGARVTLIAGPVALATPPGCSRVDVESAAEMLEAVLARAGAADLFFAVAAVADYRPQAAASDKLKKTDAGEVMSLSLVRNPDILARVAALPDGPLTLGFAAETRDVLDYARAKREQKGIDVIVANDVSDASIGFAGDANAVTIIDANGEVTLPRADKADIAAAIVRHVSGLAAARRGTRPKADAPRTGETPSP